MITDEIGDELYKKAESELKRNRRQFEILTFLLITIAGTLMVFRFYKDPNALFSLPILVIINMVFGASLVISQKTITRISKKRIYEEFTDYLNEEVAKLPSLIIEQKKAVKQNEQKLKKLLATKELNKNL